MRIMITILSLFILSSCSMLSPVKTEPDATYELNIIPPVSMKPSQRSITLLVMQPEANPTYSSNQMIYTIKPYETRYFAKNRWATSPANMLQPLIIETLQNTHHFHAVISPPFTGHYDYILNTQLLELQQDFSHQPSLIHLTLRAELINSSTNRVLATQQFSIVKVAPENTPYGGVIAANAATATLLKELAAFCLKVT